MTTFFINDIPLWIKLFYTIMVFMIIPVYWKQYGPINFLWLSDVALFLMLVAVWTESKLISSMMFLGVLPLELLWLVDFVSGSRISGISSYMFDRKLPLYLRALSLFHIVLIAVIIFMVAKYGYDARALWFQILLIWMLFPMTYVLAHRFSNENINWVYGLGDKPKTLKYPLLYLFLLMSGICLGIYFPLNWVLVNVFSSPGF